MRMVEKTCPAKARPELTRFLASSNGVISLAPLGVQALGCVFEAIGITASKVSDKAIPACKLIIKNPEVIRGMVLRIGKHQLYVC